MQEFFYFTLPEIRFSSEQLSIAPEKWFIAPEKLFIAPEKLFSSGATEGFSPAKHSPGAEETVFSAPGKKIAG